MQARIVLLKKLGLEQDVASIDIASSKEFLQTFREPLSPAEQQALNELFNGIDIGIVGWPQCRCFSCRIQ